MQGHSYCVKAMHFRQPGIVKNCNKWEMANTTNCKLPTNSLIDIASSLLKVSRSGKSVPDVQGQIRAAPCTLRGLEPHGKAGLEVSEYGCAYRLLEHGQAPVYSYTMTTASVFLTTCQRIPRDRQPLQRRSRTRWVHGGVRLRHRRPRSQLRDLEGSS